MKIQRKVVTEKLIQIVTEEEEEEEEEGKDLYCWLSWLRLRFTPRARGHLLYHIHRLRNVLSLVELSLIHI